MHLSGKVVGVMDGVLHSLNAWLYSYMCSAVVAAHRDPTTHPPRGLQQRNKRLSIAAVLLCLLTLIHRI